MIASKREDRNFDDRPILAEVVDRILDAGRLAGSVLNRQPWRFVVLDDPELKQRVAETVFAPGNIHGSQLAVALVVEGEGLPYFDVGRAAENMMLAAWDQGVGSTPNGMPDAARTAEALGLPEGQRPLVILAFGYPASGRTPDRKSAEEWSRGANRKPLDEVVQRA